MARYLTRWLTGVVEPDLEPATYAYYETMARLYVSRRWALSGSISSRCAMSRPGSTSWPACASAAARGTGLSGLAG